MGLGRGVFVGVGVFEGVKVIVGEFVGVGVSLGVGVLVGNGVSVGIGVFVSVEGGAVGELTTATGTSLTPLFVVSTTANPIPNKEKHRRARMTRIAFCSVVIL